MSPLLIVGAELGNIKMNRESLPFRGDFTSLLERKTPSLSKRAPPQCAAGLCLRVAGLASCRLPQRPRTSKRLLSVRFLPTVASRGTITGRSVSGNPWGFSRRGVGAASRGAGGGEELAGVRIIICRWCDCLLVRSRNGSNALGLPCLLRMPVMRKGSS